MKESAGYKRSTIELKIHCVRRTENEGANSCLLCGNVYRASCYTAIGYHHLANNLHLYHPTEYGGMDIPDAEPSGSLFPMRPNPPFAPKPGRRRTTVTSDPMMCCSSCRAHTARICANKTTLSHGRGLWLGSRNATGSTSRRDQD